MKNVFKADKFMLTDLAGDPQVSLEVQKDVVDYLQSSDHARMGIANELQKLKGYALPGIIQSTFVIWNEINNNKKAKKLLGNLIISICSSNQSARIFLVRVGIQRNPFQESREWLINCFIKISQNIITDEEQQMLANLDDAVRDTSPDQSEFIPLYLLYDFDMAYNIGENGIENNLYEGNNDGLEKATTILKKFENAPDSIVEELIFLYCNNIKKDGRRSIKEFNDYISKYPFVFNKDNYKGFLKGLEKTLENSSHPKKREAYVEKEFVNSFCISFKHDKSLLNLVDKEIANYEYLVKYWFQAIFAHNRSWKKDVEKYFNSRNYDECSRKYMLAFFVQYFFQKVKFRSGIEHSWIESLVNRLSDEHESEYTQAEEEVANIGSRSTSKNTNKLNFNTSGGLR